MREGALILCGYDAGYEIDQSGASAAMPMMPSRTRSAPIKGPADKLMQGLGLEVSASSEAELYRDFLDIFVFDTMDERERPQIEALGLEVVVTNTVMTTLEDKVELAKRVMKTLKE